MLLGNHLFHQRFVAVPLGMTGGGALHQAIVALDLKDLFFRESGLDELTVHVGGDDEVLLVLNQFQ